MYPRYLAGPVSARRAYTDPISNAVVNTSVNPLAIWPDLAAGRLSPEFLNVVLHETTHYSSFLSPVGYVYGALMAAHTADPIGFIRDQDKVEGPARIAIQAEVISTYLTPLLEGLALFSEFDALPGPSPVASTVSSVASLLFCKERFVSLAKNGKAYSPYDVLKQFILTSRTREDAVNRKNALLGLSLASDDGYLLGYLWLKALWRVLIGRCRKLQDTDLFLSFVIDYFFYDYQLASLIFNWQDALRSNDDFEKYIEVIEYYIFGKRLEELVANVDEYVEQYEQYAVESRPGKIYISTESHIHPQYHNFSAEAEEEINIALAYASMRSRHVMWPQFSAGRHILRLFSTPAQVEIGKDGKFRANCEGGRDHIEGSAIELARPVSMERVVGQGSVEAVMLTDEMRVVMCVFLDKELIATMDVKSGKANDRRAVTACDRLASYLSLEAASEKISEELHFREGSRAEQTFLRLCSRAKAKSYEYFSNLGLGRDNGMEQVPQVLRVLDSGGVIRILEEYPGHAEWLARLSLSCGGRVSTFDEAAAHWGGSADDIEHWLSKINNIIGNLCGKEAFAVADNSFGLCQF